MVDTRHDYARVAHAYLPVALVSWVFTVFFAGAADRILVSVGIPYETQVWLARGAVFVVPVVVGVAAYRIACELRRSELHPLRGAVSERVVRRPDGSFAVLADEAEPGAPG